MSGGHFDYMQCHCSQMADQIDEIIARNEDETLDKWGRKRGTFYTIETIEKFKEAAHTLRQAGEMAQRVDWLVSDDDGEESFHRRWKEKVRPYWLQTEETS